MQRTPQRITLNSLAVRRALSSITKLALATLCGLLLTSGALVQERRPELLPPTPELTTPEAVTKEKPPDPNETLTPVPLANQVVDGDIVFTSPGQSTYPRDIRLSDNFGGLRFFGADSLTTTPAGAAIQFFGNNASPFNGQLYLDSGALDSAALVFRTAPTGGTITERMRVTSSGSVGIETADPAGARLYVLSDDDGPLDAVVGATFNSVGYSVAGFHFSGGTGVLGSSATGTGVRGFSGSGLAGDFRGPVFISGTLGVGGISPAARTLDVNGRARVRNIPQEPSAATVCFNSIGDLLQCGASSLRLKSDVRSFSGGLDLVRRLRPISFRWKESGVADIGLGAEEVAEVAPSFVFTNSKGEVEGVKYERLNMLLINAIKEQQAQIEQQQKQIEGLKQLVCLAHPAAEVCQAVGK